MNIESLHSCTPLFPLVLIFSLHQTLSKSLNPFLKNLDVDLWNRDVMLLKGSNLNH